MFVEHHWYTQVFGTKNSKNIDIENIINGTNQLDTSFNNWTSIIENFVKYFYTHDCVDQYMNFLDSLAETNFVLAGFIYDNTTISLINELVGRISDYNKTQTLNIIKQSQSPIYTDTLERINKFEWNIPSDYDVETFIDNPIIPEDIDEWPKITYAICKYLQEDIINRFDKIGELAYKISNDNIMFYITLIKNVNYISKRTNELKDKSKKEWIKKFYKYRKYQMIAKDSNTLNIINKFPKLSENINTLLHVLGSSVNDMNIIKKLVFDSVIKYKHYQYDPSRYEEFIIDSDIISDPNTNTIELVFDHQNIISKVVINDIDSTLSEALQMIYVPNKNSEIELQKLCLMSI